MSVIGGGYELANEKRRRAAAALRDMALLIGRETGEVTALESGGTLMPGLGLLSDAADLVHRARDIEQGIFAVLVLGEFKNGKSTLLNAMLGHKTLPAKTTPATAIITVLVYGEGKDILIHEKGNESPRVLSWQEFIKEFQLTHADSESIEKNKFVDRFLNVQFAQMECTHPLCANGVKLIDSPGLGEHASRTRVTTRFLRQAQAVIFVLNATKILAEDERDFIAKQLGQGRLNHVFFVINRIDQVEEGEVGEIKQYVQERLKHHFHDESGQFDADLYNRSVFFVNAKGALDERASGLPRETVLAATAVPALEGELERFLTSEERVSAALGSTVQVLDLVIREAQHQIDRRKLALDQPLAELEKRRLEAEQLLNGLEQRRSEIERTILSFGDMIKHKVYNNLSDYLVEMRETWPQDAKVLINLDEAASLGTLLTAAVLDERKQKMATAIEREVKKYLQLKMERWQEQVVVIVEEDLKAMSIEVTDQVEAFQVEVDRVTALFAGASVDSAVDFDRKRGTKVIQLLLGFGDISQMRGAVMGEGDWTSFFGRMLQQILAVTVIFSLLAGPPAWIALLLAEAAHVWYQQEGVKERLRKKLGAVVYESLTNGIAERRDEIHASIAQQFEHLAAGLTANLRAQIEEKRAEQERIIFQKRDKAFSVQQEKDRLDLLGRKLLDLASSVNVSAQATSVGSYGPGRLAAGTALD